MSFHRNHRKNHKKKHPQSELFTRTGIAKRGDYVRLTRECLTAPAGVYRFVSAASGIITLQAGEQVFGLGTMFSPLMEKTDGNTPDRVDTKMYTKFALERIARIEAEFVMERIIKSTLDCGQSERYC